MEPSYNCIQKSLMFYENIFCEKLWMENWCKVEAYDSLLRTSSIFQIKLKLPAAKIYYECKSYLTDIRGNFPERWGGFGPHQWSGARASCIFI